MTKYLATKGDSFGANEFTGYVNKSLPDYHWLKGALKEIRRVDKLTGRTTFTRATVEWAYLISLDQLND
jgi:hypothetical protein